MLFMFTSIGSQHNHRYVADLLIERQAEGTCYTLPVLESADQHFDELRVQYPPLNFSLESGPEGPQPLAFGCPAP